MPALITIGKCGHGLIRTARLGLKNLAHTLWSNYSNSGTILRGCHFNCYGRIVSIIGTLTQRVLFFWRFYHKPGLSLSLLPSLSPPSYLRVCTVPLLTLRALQQVCFRATSRGRHLGISDGLLGKLLAKLLHGITGHLLKVKKFHALCNNTQSCRLNRRYLPR